MPQRRTVPTSPTSSPADDPGPVVRARAGAVRGLWRTGPTGRDAAFRGIPFARAPVGDLRFAAPVPVEPWDGVRDATRFGPTAQRAQLGAVTTIPEPSTPGDDVLNLTVVTPAPGDPAARLPVLVWIHGGGYVAGCQNSPWYDGAAFARDGVVTVTIGYRLGIEGWLRVAGAPDNRGLLDWLAGLAWVQENVAAFGGDPGRVTVAGQSAGGGAVLTLLAVPSAAGLLDRALAVSPALGGGSGPADADRVAARFTQRSGLAASVAALRDVPGDRLHAAMLATTTRPDELLDLDLGPCPDGDVLPDRPDSPAALARSAHVPLLVGCTRDEFDEIGAHVPAGLPAAAVAALLRRLGMGADAALGAAAEAPPAVAVGRAVTDALVRRVAVGAAEGRAAAAAAGADAAPAWLYEFAWESRAPATAGRAFHCLDLPFGWDLLAAERVEAATGPTPPQALADDVHGAWARFVAGSDPGWPAYRTPERLTRVWGEPSAVVPDAMGDVRERWLESRP